MLASILIGLMSQKLIPKRLRKAAFIFGGKHELQRKGLVLAVGFMRPLLVWRGYWIDGENVMSKETGGQAFPMLGNVGYNSDWVVEEGMTLRDYFAAKAMTSVSLSLDKGEQQLIANAAT